jgi:hypothetical protein
MEKRRRCISHTHSTRLTSSSQRDGATGSTRRGSLALAKRLDLRCFAICRILGIVGPILAPMISYGVS